MCVTSTCLDKILILESYLLLSVNLPVVAYGIAVGWCSPTIPALLSEESPLNTEPITKYESSWISSIFWIGTGFGALCSGPMIARLGRIRLLMTMGPAQIAGWLLISFAQNVYYLYCARFIMGFLGSVLFVVIPVYVTEIAHDRCVCTQLANKVSALLRTCHKLVKFALFSEVCVVHWAL